MSSAEAVCSRISATDDDDVLIPCADEFTVGDGIAFAALVLKREIFHREMNALQIASLNWQIPGCSGTARKKNGIKLFLHIIDGNIDSHVGVGAKHNAFRFQKVQTPVQNVLFHFEFRNAISQQPTDTIGAFENRDQVSGKIQLSGSRKARRTGTNDGDFLPRSHSGNRSVDPAFL